MSNLNLPPELLDHVVNLLHDKDYALRDCCLVSKSRIPRARKHLFANIVFSGADSLQSWRDLFPDPFSSPACYTHTLSVTFLPATTAACDWIKGFSRVVRFALNCDTYDPNRRPLLSPFHGFLPIVKSFRVLFAVLPYSRVLDLILLIPTSRGPGRDLLRRKRF